MWCPALPIIILAVTGKGIVSTPVKLNNAKLSIIINSNQGQITGKEWNNISCNMDVRYTGIYLVTQSSHLQSYQQFSFLLGKMNVFLVNSVMYCVVTQLRYTGNESNLQHPVVCISHVIELDLKTGVLSFLLSATIQFQKAMLLLGKAEFLHIIKASTVVLVALPNSQVLSITMFKCHYKFKGCDLKTLF